MTPWVRRLLIANVVVFVLTSGMPQLTYQLELVPVYVPRMPWTPISYMFVHAGALHIFFNMFALFLFGPRVEERLGGRRFVWLYAVSGLLGAAASGIFRPTVPVVGASGAVLGVIVGFAHYWPRARLYIWGVLPVEAMWLVIGITVWSVLGLTLGWRSHTAYGAHLGGLTGGYLVIRWQVYRSPARKFQEQSGVVAKSVRRRDVERWMAIDPSGMHEVNRAELTRVLDKIRLQGIESLTPRERDFLNRFSPE